MKQYSIFISSSDVYSDLWPVFFDLFKKYWKEFDGLIYLNTENQEFAFKGLNIKCTQVGKFDSFGKTFRAGLNQVETDDILLIMIDYFFMGNVNYQDLNEYFNYFKNRNLDSLCLFPNIYSKTEKLDFKNLRLVIPPSKDMFSYQIAFWKKSILYQMALPHETPWLSEWYGTYRANALKLKLAYTANESPIIYLAEGALHKGKWVEAIIQFLSREGYIVDFSKRGIFEDKPFTMLDRIKGRINTFWPRCLSNFDLFKRRLSK